VGQSESEVLWPEYCEFPRIDERFGLSRHRYGYVVASDPSRDFDGGGIFGPAFNTIARFDFSTGDVSRYQLDAKSTAQEPVFVPRHADAEEGDGYLLALVNRFETMLNELVLLDARDLAAGPMAVIKLPVRLRNGIHGNWVPAHLTRGR
jgi:carotenoid cleavage dioxygenase